LILQQALLRYPVDLFAYCLMPNHFHLVARPAEDGALSRLMQWFTATHSRRWHFYRGSTGTGAVYQGRFRAFPVSTDSHYLTVCRYVERNPLRAGLVTKAEEWEWSSAADRLRSKPAVQLAIWPVTPPHGWSELLNEPESLADVARIRKAGLHSTPVGPEHWRRHTAALLSLKLKAQPGGRRRK
jgi:putative transposase